MSAAAWGSELTPEPRAAPASPIGSAVASDRSWAPLARLIEASKLPNYGIGNGFRLVRSGPEYLQWMNNARQLLRSVGLSFFEQFPEDSRYPEWFVATLRCPPSYDSEETSAGTTAMLRGYESSASERSREAAEWEKLYPELRSKFFSSKHATQEQREIVSYKEIRSTFGKEYDGALKAVAEQSRLEWDIRDWEPVILRFGEEYPDSAAYARILAARVIKWHETIAKDKDALGRFQAKLGQSPNRAFRELAAANYALAVATMSPLRMRFTALDGSEVDLRNLRGKVVLIDFWATWCAPCITEMNNVARVLEKYRPAGFEVIGVCLDKAERREAVIKFIEANGIAWPQEFSGKEFKNKYAVDFGIVGIPSSLLLDKDGLLVSTSARGSQLEPLVQEYLGTKGIKGASDDESID